MHPMIAAALIGGGLGFAGNLLGGDQGVSDEQMELQRQQAERQWKLQNDYMAQAGAVSKGLRPSRLAMMRQMAQAFGLPMQLPDFIAPPVQRSGTSPSALPPNTIPPTGPYGGGGYGTGAPSGAAPPAPTPRPPTGYGGGGYGTGQPRTPITVRR